MFVGQWRHCIERDNDVQLTLDATLTRDTHVHRAFIPQLWRCWIIRVLEVSDKLNKILRLFSQ